MISIYFIFLIDFFSSILSLIIWFYLIFISNLVFILLIFFIFLIKFCFQFYPLFFCWFRILLYYFLGFSFYGVEHEFQKLKQVDFGLFLGSFQNWLFFKFFLQHLIYWELIFMFFSLFFLWGFLNPVSKVADLVC